MYTYNDNVFHDYIPKQSSAIKTCELYDPNSTPDTPPPTITYLHVDEIKHVIWQSGYVVSINVQLRLQVLAPQVLHPLDNLGLDPTEVRRVEPNDGVCKLLTPGFWKKNDKKKKKKSRERKLENFERLFLAKAFVYGVVFDNLMFFLFFLQNKLTHLVSATTAQKCLESVKSELNS